MRIDPAVSPFFISFAAYAVFRTADILPKPFLVATRVKQEKPAELAKQASM